MVGQRNVDGDDGGGLRSTLVTHNSFKHLIEGHFLLFFSSRNPNIVSTLERFSFPAKFVQHVVKEERRCPLYRHFSIDESVFLDFIFILSRAKKCTSRNCRVIVTGGEGPE